MQYKIGHKVKLIGSVCWIGRDYTNKVGIVTEIDTGGRFKYIVSIDKMRIPVEEREMVKVYIVGQQLLFDFMYGV